MSQVTSLSVVICTYNRHTSLAETLASLNACELPPCPIELVVIDNNSDDGTADVCEAFSHVSRMPFRYVLETRQGLSFARNRGIEEATGDAIIFTDDDVLVNAGWLIVYAEEFGTHHVDCAFGRVHPDWRGNCPSWFCTRLRPVWALLDYGDQRLLINEPSKEFFGANFAVRRQLLRDVGGFDVNLGRTKGKLFIGEETRLFLELLRRGCRIVYNPAIVVHHVIEERRKDKAYLRRYFHDTAESLVYAALNERRGKRVFGFPLYPVRELGTFYARALPRYVARRVRRDDPELFVLELDWIRYNRMVRLYAREMLHRGTGRGRA